MSSILDRTMVIENALVRYDGVVRSALDRLESVWGGEAGFEAGYALPPPSDRLTRMFAASELAFADLGEHAGRKLRLLARWTAVK